MNVISQLHEFWELFKSPDGVAVALCVLVVGLYLTRRDVRAGERQHEEIKAELKTASRDRGIMGERISKIEGHLGMNGKGKK